MERQGEAGAREPYIRARGLTQWSPLGSMYTDVTLDVWRGTCCAVVANSGEGKTELLLTLAGRMWPTSGTLTVGGCPIPRKCAKVRRTSGMGFFEHVNEVQPVLTVANVAAAELNLYSRRSSRRAVEAFLEEWDLLGCARQKIETLDRLTYVRLGIALGLAGDPDLLVVDDIESDLTRHQSIKLMGELCDLARERDIAVVVACTDYDLALHADEALPISESARLQAQAVDLRLYADDERKTEPQVKVDEKTLKSQENVEATGDGAGEKTLHETAEYQVAVAVGQPAAPEEAEAHEKVDAPEGPATSEGPAAPAEPVEPVQAQEEEVASRA